MKTTDKIPTSSPADFTAQESLKRCLHLREAESITNRNTFMAKKTWWKLQWLYILWNSEGKVSEICISKYAVNWEKWLCALWLMIQKEAIMAQPRYYSSICVLSRTGFNTMPPEQKPRVFPPHQPGVMYDRGRWITYLKPVERHAQLGQSTVMKIQKEWQVRNMQDLHTLRYQ